MTGPTRPSRPLSINAILAIAALCATASVLAVPKATIAPIPEAIAETSDAPAAAADQDQIQRDLTANLKAIGLEATIVFSVVDAVANAATS
ncbi:MAG: hypothetical protein Q7T55_24430 [Solirubrobacteraceae bacterium]|nr:hypothetical protein [Solirubrobacteraceae bacterium]